MMNNKLYKKLVIAMMITTISAVAAASAARCDSSVSVLSTAPGDTIQMRQGGTAEIQVKRPQQKKAAKARSQGQEEKSTKRRPSCRHYVRTARKSNKQKIADDSAKLLISQRQTGKDTGSQSDYHRCAAPDRALSD